MPAVPLTSAGRTRCTRVERLATKLGRALSETMGLGQTGGIIEGLRVGALQYLVTSETISALWLDHSGATHHEVLGPTGQFVGRIDELREELRDTMAVARGRVPRLREFSEGWGRELLPAAAMESDVVVVVPHALLHDVPLHLVRAGPSGEWFGALVGVSYSSSRSLFVRCAKRNPARREGAPVNSFTGGGADVLSGDNEPFRELVRSVAGSFDADDVQLHGENWPHTYTRSALKAAFRAKERFDVLCVAAHGYTDPLDHRMSGLMVEHDTHGLAARVIPLHGGRYFDFRDLPLRGVPGAIRPATRTDVLTAAELEVDGHIDTQLVVLLACSAGWGRVLEGDAPASLAESFLHIGAPSVVAPMWDSDYDASRAWIQGFFDAWVDQGHPKALATRDVVQQMQEGPHADRPERIGALALRGDWL